MNTNFTPPIEFSQRCFFVLWRKIHRIPPFFMVSFWQWFLYIWHKISFLNDWAHKKFSIFSSKMWQSSFCMFLFIGNEMWTASPIINVNVQMDGFACQWIRIFYLFYSNSFLNSSHFYSFIHIVPMKWNPLSGPQKSNPRILIFPQLFISIEKIPVKRN